MRHLSHDHEGDTSMSHPHHDHEGDTAMSHHDHHSQAVAPRDVSDWFSRDTGGLPGAASPETVNLRDGDVFGLRIQPVRKRIGDAVVRMLGYNGSIPGPTLHVDQGSEITVTVTNDGDVATTVHWHGLRLENRYDGVPHETQIPIAPGGTFTYKLQFPDAGLYWYHPHIREDFAQEMGLYAPIIVEPSYPSYWLAADRQLTLTLDDVLIEDGKMAPFRRSGPTYTAMGRFGNVMLINGESEFSGEAAVGEVVRLYLVNTANTRIFNFALRGGARMKLIGGDSGRYERETFVEEVLLSPSERAVVDVLFDTPGEVHLEHRTPDHVYDLGLFAVAGAAAGDAASSFEEQRTDPELSVERRLIERDFEREPDKVLSFVASMPLLYGGEVQPASSYVCPMHPEVTASEPETCPKCGMRLVPVQMETLAPSSYVCPMHPEVTASEPTTCPKCGMKLVPSDALPASEPHEGHDHHAHKGHTHGGHDHGDHGGHEHSEHHHDAHDHGDHGDGLEWEDLMPEINRATDPSNMIWKLIDRETGAENHAISWAFKVGDRVKVRLVNEMDSDHPMHHPFHVHGAGRFLILSRGGKVEPNLVWKDTVLVRAGETVDILLYVTNPGLWMAHCHIAEHTESGMMFSFEVEEADLRGSGKEAN
jgi:FtsP/CotA-like multicopper oxidase with cupredoxin domain